MWKGMLKKKILLIEIRNILIRYQAYKKWCATKKENNKKVNTIMSG